MGRGSHCGLPVHLCLESRGGQLRAPSGAPPPASHLQSPRCLFPPCSHPSSRDLCRFTWTGRPCHTSRLPKGGLLFCWRRHHHVHNVHAIFPGTTTHLSSSCTQCWTLACWAELDFGQFDFGQTAKTKIVVRLWPILTSAKISVSVVFFGLVRLMCMCGCGAEREVGGCEGRGGEGRVPAMCGLGVPQFRVLRRLSRGRRLRPSQHISMCKGVQWIV